MNVFIGFYCTSNGATVSDFLTYYSTRANSNLHVLKLVPIQPSIFNKWKSRLVQGWFTKIIFIFFILCPNIHCLLKPGTENEGIQSVAVNGWLSRKSRIINWSCNGWLQRTVSKRILQLSPVFALFPTSIDCYICKLCLKSILAIYLPRS